MSAILIRFHLKRDPRGGALFQSAAIILARTWKVTDLNQQSSHCLIFLVEKCSFVATFQWTEASKKSSDAVNDFFLLACNNGKEKSTQLTHKLTLSLPSHQATGIDSQSKMACVYFYVTGPFLSGETGSRHRDTFVCSRRRCVKREDDRAAFYFILWLNSFFCVWQSLVRHLMTNARPSSVFTRPFGVGKGVNKFFANSGRLG